MSEQNRTQDTDRERKASQREDGRNERNGSGRKPSGNAERRSTGTRSGGAQKSSRTSGSRNRTDSGRSAHERAEHQENSPERRRKSGYDSGHRSSRQGQKKRKRKYNPFLEWLSDYLPYIIIVGVIILVIIVVLLIVNGVKKSGNASSSAAKETVQTISAVPSASTSSESVKKDSSVSSSSAGTTVVKAAASLNIDDSTIELDHADSTVSDTVNNYFNSLLSTQANPAVEAYNDIVSYTYPENGGAQIVFVQYTYKYRDFEENIPGLTELYIQDGQVVEDLTEEQNQQMTDAANSAEASSLINQVQSAYDSVLASDPALQSYVSSLEGGSSTSSSSSSSSSASSTAGTSPSSASETGSGEG
ncbi:MAG: hypothetical protein SOH80_05060 [Eubacteriales bacterium]|jgi:flagellar basal body-associated protein FliL